MQESGATLRYLCSKHPQLRQFYGLEQGQDNSFKIRHQIDELLDFNGTVLRPAYVGALSPLLMKRFLKQDTIPQDQKDK